MEVRYRRLPDRERTYRQELLEVTPDYRITLLIRSPDADPLSLADDVEVPGGAYLLWFTFPGSWREIGVFYGPDGRALGTYVNLIRPLPADAPLTAPTRRLPGSGPPWGLGVPENAVSRPGPGAEPVARWRITDLFLDVWCAPGAPPRPLDEEELREALERDWLDSEEAERAVAERDAVLEEIRAGRFPPDPVDDRPLESVPLLRLARDEPGAYHAALLSGRIIGYGLYLLGTISVTSLGFAAFTDALERGGPQEWWLGVVGAEALVLLPLALGGRLPATRWPRPVPADERTFVLGTVATALAVLLFQESETWRGLLIALYGIMGFFLLLFAVSRAWYERRFPTVASAGLAVALLALLFLA